MSGTSTFTFTAFTKSDLQDAGISGKVSCGDTFTMPGSATTCISVTDNDSRLSGDGRKNERADDHSYQTATVEYEDGSTITNAKVYAEAVHTLKGSDGKTYRLIEIESNGDKTGDLFTFEGDVPPAGVELKVTHTNWGLHEVKYSKLDAGSKQPVPAPDKIVVEAEDLELSGGYYVEHRSDGASDGALIRTCGTGYAKLKDFKGESCPYDIQLRVIDENDGKGFIDIFVDGKFVHCIRLDENDGGNGANGHSSYKTITVEDIFIPEGATVTFKGRQEGGEYVRIDQIAFCKDKPDFRTCDDPDAVKIDFEGFAAGTIVDDEYAALGVTISATGGSGDAMVFDSFNPTGGDTDLATTTQGNILIVSEDGDSSDPDDNIGGTLTFTFDNPSRIFDIKVVDTEEGGTITATLADGSTQSFAIPRIGDGEIDQVILDVDDVVSLEVELNGSGAIDDLCFVPGAPQLGSLSGRYFMDTNRNDVDDAEPGIAGVLVELLDAAGVPTGATVLTGADGSYSFTDLAPGSYGVKFTDTVSGKELVAPNRGVDDTIDSDAIALGGGMSQITGITVVAGQETPDNDAGVAEIPGALSGRYFCDEDGDAVDDGPQNGDPGVAGKTVTLLNADGSPAVDIDGQAVTPVRTDDQGNYRFVNLAAGSYVVMFEASAAEGKAFVAPDAGNDDSVDSDVIDLVNGKTAPVTVVAGQETRDVDAGVFTPNTDPEPRDDAASVCATEEVTIGVLNTSPSASVSLSSVAHVEGTELLAGQTVTLASGAEVTLNPDGSLSYDSAGATYEVDGQPVAAADLLIGEMAMDSFTYSVSDGEGGTGTATVDIKICGAKNTLETIAASLPDQVVFEIDRLSAETAEDGYQVTLSGTGDARFDGVVVDPAYCVEIFQTIIVETPILADMTLATEEEAAAAGLGARVVENIDLINWVLNQDFGSQDNGDGTGETYKELEIQAAIWGLSDDSPFIAGAPGQFGTLENAQEIIDLAFANGEGFEAGEGDIIGLLLDPVDNDPSGHDQAFVIGIAFDSLAEDCLCFV